MTEVKQKIASKTASKNSPPVSSKQKSQNTQAGGPTIGGVAGVGKQKTVTRPKSAQSTKTPSPHGVRTGPMGEGKESEFSANRSLEHSVRMKAYAKKNYKPAGSGMNDYYAHNAKKTAIKEDGGVAMSVGSGAAVPSITNATANYAFQVKKKVRDKIARRKKPV